MELITFLSPNGAGSIVRLAQRDCNTYHEELHANSDLPVKTKTAGEFFYKYVPDWIRDRMSTQLIEELFKQETANALSRFVNKHFVTGV